MFGYLVDMVTGEYHMRDGTTTWIWLRESTICVDFGLVTYSGLIILCYHDYVVRSWIGYVIMVMMGCTGNAILSWLCSTILFYVYPIICGFLAEPRLAGMWFTRRY